MFLLIQAGALILRAKMPLMQRLDVLKRFRPFLGYLLLIVVILSSAVLLGRYSRQNKLDNPNNSLSALKVELNELSLAASGMASVDSKAETAASALARTENELKKSIESARSLAEQHTSELDPDVYSQIISSLDHQQSLVNTYKSRFELVGKAIQYNPSLDLESLDPNDNQQLQELQSRAAAARDNLQKLSAKKSGSNLTIDNFTLSAKTENNLTNSIACFDGLAKSNSTNYRRTASDRDECVALYPQFRQSLVNDLLSIYQDQAAQVSLDNISKLANSL